MPSSTIPFTKVLADQNLEVLAKFIHADCKGRMAAKLYVHPDGRFEFMDSGITTAFKRTWGDRVQSLKDAFVLNCIKDVFEISLESFRPKNIKGMVFLEESDENKYLVKILAGFFGFLNLASHYEGNPAPKESLLQIWDEKPWILKARLKAYFFYALRQSPQVVQLLAFDQGEMLDKINTQLNGHCFGITMEWHRRFVTKGKISWASATAQGKNQFILNDGVNIERYRQIAMLRKFKAAKVSHQWFQKKFERISIFQNMQSFLDVTSYLDPNHDPNDISEQETIIHKETKLSDYVNKNPVLMDFEKIEKFLYKVRDLKNEFVKNIILPQPTKIAIPCYYMEWASDLVKTIWHESYLFGRTRIQEFINNHNTKMMGELSKFPEYRNDPAFKPLNDADIKVHPTEWSLQSYFIEWSGIKVLKKTSDTSKNTGGHAMGLHFYFPKKNKNARQENPRYIFFDPNFGEFDVEIKDLSNPDGTPIAVIFALYSLNFDFYKVTISRVC